MMITGRIWKDGNDWLAESETVDVCTQGTSQADAVEMLADAIETLVDRSGFKVYVGSVGSDGAVAVESNEPALFAAFVLQRLRERSGLSLADVAVAMGKASKNAFARYEQGEAVPTIDKFEELLRAVSPNMTICIAQRDPAFRVLHEAPIGEARATFGEAFAYVRTVKGIEKTPAKEELVITARKAKSPGSRIIVPKPKKRKAASRRGDRLQQKPAQR